MLLVTALAGTSIANAASNGPVRIGENDWTGQWVSINLAKVILEDHMDQDVELVFIDYPAQWAALASNDLDVGMEMWPSYSYDAHKEWVDEKQKVEVVGDLGVIGETGWYVPTYVVEGDSERGIEPMAPGLKSYQDMNKYSELFKRPETGDKGFCLDAVASWQAHNGERLESLELDYVNVFAGTEGAFFAEIEAAYAKGEPLMLCYAWKPHWMFAKYDLTEIELPPYTDECYGLGDESADYACDFPDDELYIISRAGFKDDYPKAHQFLANLNLPTEAQEWMIFQIDQKGMTPEQAVRAWMADNEDVWRPWIPN